MKRLQLLLLVLFFSGVYAQEKSRILTKELVSDYSKIPFISRIAENVTGNIHWKEGYTYIDSIDVYKIAYVSDGLKVHGLLVTPKKKGTYPCIIYNRGGNRNFGALSEGHGLVALGKIAKEGYVVIASQYRGNAGGEGNEEFGGADVNDVTVLPEVLKEISKADVSRIGMYGWSRGGMMTYIALTKMKNIKAAVVGGAVSDCFGLVNDRPKMESAVLAQVVPAYAEHKQQELTKRSAVHWVADFPKEVPILMLHGNADWRVKPEQSLQLALEFEKYRIPYRLVMFEGGSHGISEHKKEVNEQVLAWFARFLKNEEQLPNMEYHGR